MLTVNAFARAVRACKLTYIAIGDNLTEELWDNIFSNGILILYVKLVHNEISHSAACYEKTVKLSLGKLTDRINKIKSE